MPLDPYIAAKAQSIVGLTRADLEHEEARERFHQYFTDDEPWTRPPHIAVVDDVVESDSGPIPIRVYTPPTEKAAPLVWMHGGGFAFGDLDMPESDMVSAELAARAGCTVVAVDYRLASESVRFPAPVDDIVAVWRSVAERSELGAPAVGGASAGAALAVSSAIRLRDEAPAAPRAMLLAYPFLHFPNPGPESELAAELAGLPPLLRITPEGVAVMVAGYVGRLTNVPPAAMPGAADLRGLPPAFIVPAEMDDLRPSAALFEQQLTEVGVAVRTQLATGMPHGHLNRLPSVPAVDRSLEFFASALRGI